MKRGFIYSIAGILIVVTTMAVLWYGIKPAADSEDIIVEGKLELNKTGVNADKEYLLNIEMIKSKDSQVAIYPYIDGLGLMSFSDADKGSFFVPGSIGSDGITEPIALSELKEKMAISNEADVSLISFWFPDEAGQYKARVYLDKLDTFAAVKNPVLICVYVEKKFGKLLTWSKTIPIME